MSMPLQISRRANARGALVAGLMLWVIGAARPAWAESTALPSPLHLREAISLARAQRAEIAAVRARTAAAHQVPKAVSLPDPMVMVGADHVPLRLHGLDASLQVQQDFPLSGALGAKRRAAEADVAVWSAEIGTTTLDVEREAASAFLMVVETERMVALTEELSALAKQALAIIRARLQGGDGAASDLVRAQIEVLRLEGDVKALQADLRSASAMLEAALGQPVTGNNVACALSTPTRAVPSLTAVVASAMESRPELWAARARATREGANVDVMRTMYKPMAFVRGGTAYRMTEGPGVMLMVGVTVPLWRERLRAGVDEASAMQSMAAHDVLAMGRMIEGEAGAAREALAAAQARWDVARDSLVPLSRRSLSLLLASYAGGQAPLVSVLEGLRTLREARMQEITAEIRVNLAWLRLGRATGKIEATL